jgi:hypothetical protein
MFVRLAIAADPRRFGRAFESEEPAAPSAHSRLGDDIRLFAVTFLCGFIFVSVFLA